MLNISTTVLMKHKREKKAQPKKFYYLARNSGMKISQLTLQPFRGEPSDERREKNRMPPLQQKWTFASWSAEKKLRAEGHM